MRGTWTWIAMVGLMGCGTDSLDAPDDCNPGELHLMQDGIDERMLVSNFAFVNAFGGGKGTFTVGPTIPIVSLEFTKLTADGDTADVRGSVVSMLVEGGNCETGGYPSKLFVGGDSSWRFEVRDAHDMPYCSALAVANVSGCYRAAK